MTNDEIDSLAADLPGLTLHGKIPTATTMAFAVRIVELNARVLVVELERTAEKRIVDLVVQIMDNGTMVVETPNEAVLVKLLELRGTPIPCDKGSMDIDRYWLQWKEESAQDDIQRRNQNRDP